MDALEAIHARRSISRLVAPAPNDEELQAILGAAASAPDHGALRPFRFAVITAEAMAAFGDVLADAYVSRSEARHELPDAAQVEKERTKIGRAPVVVVVSAARQRSEKVSWEEQVAAVAAGAQNALVAATALGYGSMWRTGAPTTDPRVKAALGLGEDDAIVGFLYLGTVAEGGGKPPNQPDLDGLVTTWAP